jgi:death-on-curing protein
LLYLCYEDVVDVASAIGTPAIRSRDGLASAVGRPQASAFGEDAYPTLTLKAAALMESLAENQPFVDGNKRVAWAGTIFLQLNGITMHATTEEGLDLLLNRVPNGMTVEELSDWIDRHNSAFAEQIPDE